MAGLNDYIQFLETLNESIIIYTDDKVIWANKQLSDFLGYDSPDEVIGTHPFSHVHPDNLLDIEKNTKIRMRESIKSSGHWKLRTKQGTYKSVFSNGSTNDIDGKRYLVSIIREPSRPIPQTYSSSELQHDLLTPLTIAKGYLEILREKATDHDTIKHLNTVSDSCNKLEENIRKLLDTVQELNLLEPDE